MVKNDISVSRRGMGVGSDGRRYLRTEELASVDVEFVAVHDNRPWSSRLPYNAADLGFAQTIHAHPFNGRRGRQRRWTEKAGRLDPIEDATLWGNEDGVKRTVLCKRKVHRKCRTRPISERETLVRGAGGRCGGAIEKTTGRGFSWEIEPRDSRSPGFCHAGRPWAQLAVLSTTIGFFVLRTSTTTIGAETSGFNEPDMATTASRATGEAVCNQSSDWFRLAGRKRTHHTASKKYTIIIIAFQASVPVLHFKTIDGPTQGIPPP